MFLNIFKEYIGIITIFMKPALKNHSVPRYVKRITALNSTGLRAQFAF